ncbi:MAG: FAD binding domain-containing protein [Deltaproteobacteria bacterium]|nr:FAD binding domain-containing protein [Deltaproteobacteria bacterium]
MLLPAFALHQPTSVDGAVALAARLAPDFDWVAGGTDLLPNYKQRLNARPHVVSLARVAELRDLSTSRIGALVRLRDLERDPAIRATFPALADAASQIASTTLRESGTVGGNLCLDNRCYYFNQSELWRDAKGGCLKVAGPICLVVPTQKENICWAAYSGDLAPVLQVLGASVGIAGPDGRRTVPLVEFFQPDGIRRNVLARGELLTHVEIPETAKAYRAGYRKLRQRDTIDFPILGVAAAVHLEGDTVRDVRVSLTAVDTIPVWIDLADERDKRMSLAWIERIAARVLERVQPVKNVSLRPGYRRKMAAVLTRRLLVALTT